MISPQIGGSLSRVVDFRLKKKKKKKEEEEREDLIKGQISLFGSKLTMLTNHQTSTCRPSNKTSGGLVMNCKIERDCCTNTTILKWTRHADT